MKPIELLPIDRAGNAGLPVDSLPAMVRENCEGTAGFYDIVGYEPPWIGYLSVHEGTVVGGGAFKGAPQEGRVEIAYYTLPEFEGRGFATAIARALVAIARSAVRDLEVTAQTLPETNASNTLLQKIGFVHAGTIDHHEDGAVWEWRYEETSGEGT